MKHFKRKEFACKCGCGFDTVDYELAMVVDAIRSHFGKPTHVNSGCRCEAHNRKVGGKQRIQGKPNSGSQHLYGRAADILVDGVSPSLVAAWVKQEFPKISIGTYDSFTHLDSRTGDPKFWGIVHG